MADSPKIRREQIQDELGYPLSYAPGVEATQSNELPTKNYVDTHTPPPVPGVLFDCPAAVSVGDVVYISGINTVDRSLHGAPSPTPDAIGVVLDKPASTQCHVISVGDVTAYSGLTPGAVYYVSGTVPGGITNVAPSALGEKVQKAGIAASASRLYVHVSPMTVVL